MSQKESSSQKSSQTTGLSPYQKEIVQDLSSAYSPYIGTGTLGGLSELEQQSLDMLKSANIWSPMVEAGKGLITGTAGAQPITNEQRDTEWSRISKELTDIEKNVNQPARQEAYAGPGYWSSARRENQVTGYGPSGRSSFADYLGEGYKGFRWDVDQYNRELEQQKAGTALSAINAVPAALSGWAGQLFGTGSQAREIVERITDPEVLDTLFKIVGIQTQPILSKTSSTYSPSAFQQAMNWGGAVTGGLQGMQDAGSGFLNKLGGFAGGFFGR